MTRFWIFFTLAVMVYMGANAWNEDWIGQDAVRVLTCALLLILGLIVWACLGNNGESK